MLNLVPLACSGRKVTNRHCQTVPVGELLDAVFPQSVSTPVATATIGGDQKLRGVRITTTTKHAPPAIDAFHGELSRVVTDSDVHKTLVLCFVIKAVGICRALGQRRKVVGVDQRLLL